MEKYEPELHSFYLNKVPRFNRRLHGASLGTNA
jgi:hypothetical protein